MKRKDQYYHSFANLNFFVSNLFDNCMVTLTFDFLILTHAMVKLFTKLLSLPTLEL